MKKKDSKSSLKIWSLYLQIFMSIVLCVLFIIFLFNHSFLPYLEISVGLLLMVLSINSYIFTKKKIMSIIYSLVGLLIIIFTIVKM